MPLKNAGHTMVFWDIIKDGKWWCRKRAKRLLIFLVSVLVTVAVVMQVGLAICLIVVVSVSAVFTALLSS